jgi:hypothetical protein
MGDCVLLRTDQPRPPVLFVVMYLGPLFWVIVAAPFSRE